MQTTESTRKPTPETDPELHLVFASEDQNTPITLERRGDDVFFVSPLGEVIAALVQMGPSQLCVAVA